ncbi:D-alanine--poly(phosphoribitol) ligase subunit DltA [Lacticaseibacillus kribbianus]|uniref:D-alanine--poly(phosphoribitol) ligase subunit DltA n=1 Tax=Lacticaseibacillus kribbianus TaxID=2926292 RepID=UPI001CD1A17C|nr:D-alanine--poly(phosphoribitol) ligase subunit DltA [Lacticaseibacillus kribbianus]
MQSTIIEAIDAVAMQEPNRPAIDVLGQVNTYGELKAASDAIAADLAVRPIAAKTPILVYCDQSFAAIAAFLGCVKAGHAYIPVDTHSPKDRLTMIEDIAKPALVIATVPLPLTLHTPTVTPEQLQATMQDGAAAPAPSLQGGDNFYIIFTSGTTGQPKGVQISLDNLASFVAWMADFNLPTQAKMLAQAPFSFDLSVMSLYPALTAGGCLKVLPKETTADLRQLVTALPDLDVDVWVSTPSFIEMCLLDPTFDAAHHPNLRQLFFCGEELTHKTAARLLDRFPAAELFNTYGPTEATVAVTAVRITQDILARYPRLPIGYAKPDTTLRLIAETAQQEGDRVIGELAIAGPSVSKGYLNRPNKTAAVFTTDRGVQAYRTGDLGYIEDDGLIFYCGRTDFQIKLNGYRIELEEVNHYLNLAPMIRQGVAVPRYNREHKVAALLAYVVPADPTVDPATLTTAIHEHLQGVMMAYMIPSRFEFKDSLPLTQNGKVAIKALIQEVNA